MTYHINYNFVWQYFDKFYWGLLLGIEMAAISILIGALLGLALALVFVDGPRWARRPVAAYVEFIRNQPLLLLVYFVFYGVPAVGGFRYGNVTSFVITLSIQRETGGNLGETLENLTEMLRKRRQVKLKVKALSSEAKASAIIIGSLPFILFVVLYFLNRDYVMMLFTHRTGPYLVGAGIFMQALGIGVMAKMVRFDI